MSDKLRAAALAALNMLNDYHDCLQAANILRVGLSETQMPTKIFGPNLEETLNAAGFYRKKEWVGLTAEDMADAHNSTSGDVMMRLAGFARAVEAKLKDKNCG